MVFRISIPLFLISIFISSPAFGGGPWTPKKNGGYAQLSFSTIGSNRLWNNFDEPFSLYRKVHDLTLQAFAEYGITNNLTLSGSIPFKFVSTNEEIFMLDTLLSSDTFPAGNLSGLSNISLALKYRLIDTRWKLAVQLRTDTRTTVTDPRTGLQTGYDCWSFQPMVLFGSSAKAFYFIVSTGLTIRTNNFSEAFNASAEAGYSFFNKKTQLILTADLNKSFLNDSTQNTLYLNTGLYVNNQEFLAYGLKINQAIGEQWMINVGVLGAAFGNLVAYAPSFNAGLAYKW